MLTAAATGVAQESPYRLPFEIETVDNEQSELVNILPIKAVIIGRKSSSDGGEYYLAELSEVISSNSRVISHLIVGGRLVGRGISPAMKDLPINIAYVLDKSLIEQSDMDFSKAEFTAIGTASARHNK